MKAIPDALLVVAAAALSLAAGFLFNWYAAAGVALACWLGLTWYNADPGSVFGPPEKGRVTFKQVLLNFGADVVELFMLDKLVGWTRRFWAWLGPRITNPQLWVWAGSVGAAFFGSDPMTLMQTNPHAFVVIVIIIVLVSTLLNPFGAPAGAPATIPQPEPGGLRGPGAEHFEARGAARA